MDFPFLKEAISQLFSRSSCEMYPAVPREAAPGYRGRIVYHADKCIGCGMCERVCSGSAITRTVEKVEEGDRITLTFNLGSCTFCATCADFCSTKAIEFSGDYHMIATKEEDLLVTGTHIKPARKPAPPKPAAPAAGTAAPAAGAAPASSVSPRDDGKPVPCAPENARRALSRSTARQRRGSAATTNASAAAPAPQPAPKRR